MDETGSKRAKEQSENGEDDTPIIENDSRNNLPKEIIWMIRNLLRTPIDIFRIRAVCKSWRSSVQVTTSSWQNFSSPKRSVKLTPFKIYRLEDEHRISSCLVKIVDTTQGQVEIGMKLMNPLSRPNFKKTESSCKSTKLINMLKLRLVEITRDYHLQLTFSYQSIPSLIVSKAVLIGDCGVLAIGETFSKERKLEFLGFGADEWVNLGSSEINYDDVVVYKGQFYVIDCLGVVSWVDARILKLVQYSPPVSWVDARNLKLVQYSPPVSWVDARNSNRVEAAPQFYGNGQVKNLVVSNEELYVVDSYIDKEPWRRIEVGLEEIERVGRECITVDMRVYKLDEDLGIWVPVYCLDDRVFFLGYDCSFSVSSRDFPGCEGNCICFMDQMAGYQHDYYIARVFRLGDRSIRRIGHSPSLMRMFNPPTDWFCSL